MEIAKLTPTHIQELESKLLRDGKKPKGAQMVHNSSGDALKHALRADQTTDPEPRKMWRKLTALRQTPPHPTSPIE